MEALSGLTPALSRRLQKQLLAQLPPAAARSLRRTLSLQHAPVHRNTCVRTHSANKAMSDYPRIEDSTQLVTDKIKKEISETDSIDNKEPTLPAQNENKIITCSEKNIIETEDDIISDVNLFVPQYSTLPRPKKQTTLSRESTPPVSSPTDLGYDYTSKISLNKDSCHSRGSSIRSTPDRPLLSKYLTPERTISFDDSFSSDSGSILSEPSYIAAYGTPSSVSGITGLNFRRHSMRLSKDIPRKRISRFLRPDFYDTPLDESVYAKHKKEKELETQEVLKEIREKKNKSIDSPLSPRCIVDSNVSNENSGIKKCFSPVTITSGKERSRSNTPFFPILDNIKESAFDTTQKYSNDENNKDIKCKFQTIEPILKESKLVRPKSYPVKTEKSKAINEEINKLGNSNEDSDGIDVIKDNKLLRPKSYPANSSSPEKICVNRHFVKNSCENTENKQNIPIIENKTDVEVTFNISLPNKAKIKETTDVDSHIKEILKNKGSHCLEEGGPILELKKYEVNKNNKSETNNSENSKLENDTSNGISRFIKMNKINSKDDINSTINVDNEIINKITKKEDKPLKESSETNLNEKKPNIKKKIIRKVSSKIKTEAEENQEKNDIKMPTDKKKVIRKLREKINDDIKKNVDDKKETSVKKKSVLQSIGQKLEKFTSTKSNILEKDKSSTVNTTKNDSSNKNISKLTRNQREHSVPVQSEPPSESNIIKRAVTLTDVAALESQSAGTNKTTVSKVLGLFKKFDSKEKVNKADSAKNISDLSNSSVLKSDVPNEALHEKYEDDKPKRPTSLLLNGLGRKYKYGRTASDNVSVASLPNCTETVEKKDETKNLRNSLKLDFSRLPRVKKIVPTNSVIEPQIMDPVCNKETEKTERSNTNEISNIEIIENRMRSRSRTKSDNSSETRMEDKSLEKNDNENTNHPPQRTHETTTPEKEDIGERIRRKSFYTRFNEKRQRRKSNLVGPGAPEYDPVARLHSQPDSKYDTSPTSPVSYDLSPGFSSVTSDLSPNERYRSLMTDLSANSRNGSRFDNYGLNDKVDSYRSLDRNEFRKYPSSRNYVDCEPSSTYGSRYTRTLSLLDSGESAESKEPQKYNRTLSLYAPGSYATYRPKRVRNSAIILKENEKEPSPENILDKIRQKKISISVTRKPDPETEPQRRCVCFSYIVFTRE